MMVLQPRKVSELTVGDRLALADERGSTVLAISALVELTDGRREIELESIQGGTPYLTVAVLAHEWVVTAGAWAG